MPAVRLAPDHCKTAAEVREAAARSVLFRRNAFRRRPAPPPPAPAPPEPQPIVPDEPPRRVSVRKVLEVAADYFGVECLDLVSERKKWPLVFQRQITMFVALKATGRSLPHIGRLLYRDHTTVLHGTRVIQRKLDDGDSDVAADVIELMFRLDIPFAYTPPLVPRQPPPPCAPSSGDWTGEEIAQLVCLYAEEKRTAGQTAKILGRTESGVYMKAKRLGLTKRPGA